MINLVAATFIFFVAYDYQKQDICITFPVLISKVGTLIKFSSIHLFHDSALTG